MTEPDRPVQRPPYLIGIVQTGATLTISSVMHPYCVAVFKVNEEVGEGCFSTRSCQAFRERVTGIWGPGGARSVVSRDENGKPKDHYGWLPWDGKLGKFPDSRAPED